MKLKGTVVPHFVLNARRKTNMNVCIP